MFSLSPSVKIHWGYFKQSTAEWKVLFLLFSGWLFSCVAGLEPISQKPVHCGWCPLIIKVCLAFSYAPQTCQAASGGIGQYNAIPSTRRKSSWQSIWGESEKEKNRVWNCFRVAAAWHLRVGVNSSPVSSLSGVTSHLKTSYIQNSPSVLQIICAVSHLFAEVWPTYCSRLSQNTNVSHQGYLRIAPCVH